MGLLDRAPPQRDVREDPFDFETDEERQVYEAVTRYIDRRAGLMTARRNAHR